MSHCHENHPPTGVWLEDLFSLKEWEVQSFIVGPDCSGGQWKMVLKCILLLLSDVLFSCSMFALRGWFSSPELHMGEVVSSWLIPFCFCYSTSFHGSCVCSFHSSLAPPFCLCREEEQGKRRTFCLRRSSRPYSFLDIGVHHLSQITLFIPSISPATAITVTKWFAALPELSLQYSHVQNYPSSPSKPLLSLAASLLGCRKTSCFPP